MPADQSSPTRLFATLSGAVLVIGGTAGFFHYSGFGTPGDVEDGLGFAVNGWINTLHIIMGALGLLAAGFAARLYSLAAAVLFGTLAIWGFALGGDEAILDRFPADEAENLLHAALAVLGLVAWLAERPRRERKPPPERTPRTDKRDDGGKRRAKGAERDEKKRREERRKRDEKRREERRRREAASEEPQSEARPGGEDRSQQNEAGSDSASRGDEPRKRRERPSRLRRRPRQPPA